ncbi:hypothetical protein ACQP1W_17715 [Spirillospora sp. CA-255316]
MSSARLTAIQDVGGKTYAITLIDDRETRRTFTLTVDDSDIPVVSASDELTAACKLHMSVLKPVFQAVLAFHAASRADIAIDLAAG